MSYTLNIEKHDQWQLELKSIFYSNESQDIEISVWFALPMAIGISSHNYSKSNFYRDVRSYTRLNTPEISLENLLDAPHSPLKTLQQNIDAPIQEKYIRKEMKLWCTIFQKSMVQADFDTKTPDKALELIEISQKLIVQWRGILDKSHKHSRKTQKCAHLVDEMISIRFETSCIWALKEFKEKVVDQIIPIIQQERQHREKHQYMKLSDIENGNTTYLRKISNLKKYTSSVLFLEEHSAKWHHFLQHIIFGIAAGIAMAWAIFAQLFALLRFGINPSSNMSASLILTFLGVGIISYILKDRIKATTSAYLFKKFSKYIFDQHFYYSLPNQNKIISEISERMNFVKLKEIPKSIKQEWDELINQNFAFSLGGDTLHYYRKLKIHPNNASAIFQPYQGLVDINRFHLGQWVRTFADPKKRILILNDKNNIKSRSVHRIYTVDIGIQVTHNNQVEQHYAKLFLNQNGIVKVENLVKTEKISGDIK